MACPTRSDQLFGPRVNPLCRSLDFTLFFEDSILSCLPAACLLLCAVPSILRHSRQSKSTVHRSKSILIAKLAIWGAILVAHIIFAVFRNGNHQLTTKASIASDVLNMLASTVAPLLSFAAHRTSPCPSTVLVLYLSTQALLLIPRLRTIWIISPDTGAAASVIAVYVLTIASLVTESAEETPAQAKESHSSKEPYIGFWNRTSFAWMLDIFRLGNRTIISQSDLPLLDPKLQSRQLRDSLLAAWTPDTRKRHRSLFYANAKLLSPLVLSTVIPRLCQTAFTFAQPFMINTTVKYISQAGANPNYGKGLIGAWALVYLGIAVSHSVFQYQLNRITATARGALLAVIHDHSMRTRVADSGEITAVTLMGTDVQRITSGLHFFCEVWGCVIDIGVACWLLEQQLSLACLAPIIMTLLFIAITSKVSATSSDLQRQWTERVQERLKVTSALLSDMKAVKMLGIAPIMSGIVANLRTRELETSKGFRKVLAAVILLSLSPINLAPIVTFGIYIIIAKFWKNETLLTAQAFTAVSLIALLTTPVIVFIQGLPQLLQSFSGYDRIQEYCNYSSPQEALRNDEVEAPGPDSKSSIPSGTIGSHNHSVSVTGSSFSWDKKSGPVLLEIDIEFAQSKVTTIAGVVGSGKSALLNAIIGEMYSENSVSHLTRPSRRRMAYCAQEPWLENGTIGRNITGPLPISQPWYDRVKWSCGLDEDIDLMPSSDDTNIGTNGYSLSGGQKQRVALARAAYAQEKVVVLDDVFSGMDAKTAMKVGTRLFGKRGLFRESNTTVIMATHNGKIMGFSDNTIVLEGGKVVENGPTQQLLQTSAHLNKAGVVSTSTEQCDNDNESQSPQLETRAKVLTKKDDNGRQVEDLKRKTGDLRIYGYYVKSGGYFAMTVYSIFIIIWTFGTEASTIWIKQWAEANEKHPNQNAGYHLGIYAVIGLVSVAGACLAGWSVLLPLVTNSATSLHSDLLQTTFRAPFLFFTKTDSGELLNRFSQDMELVDMDLPLQMMNYTSGFCSCIARLVVVAVFSKYLGITTPFFIIALYFIQRFYLRTSRQLRLLTIEGSAPLYTHFTESVAGAATIRAFGWERYYEERCLELNDNSRRPQYLLANLQTCLTFVLEILMTVMVIGLAAIVISLRDKFSAGSVGVSLVMVVGFGDTLVRLISSWTTLETSIGAVARVRRFLLDTPSEQSVSYDMPTGWPHSGKVEFADVTVSYEPRGDAVLKNVQFSIASGAHVAICGRTGSGKSSLIASILRMTCLEQGNILIDDVELSKLAPDDIRPRINAVPQDPFLFPGTMRRNMDPFGEAANNVIQKALQRVNLWDIVNGHGGLDKEIDTEAWSAGQKQLLCFARAMVRNSKVLVLDEAASNVDAETEELMQNLIDTQFKNCTVISVMHRLKYVTRYDRVAVMDAGEVVEFDAPDVLLAGDSKFAEMYSSAK